MTYIPMIDQTTGEIDNLLVVQRAETRACSEWGGPNPPPNYHRQALAWCLERAQSERLQWRDIRGLPREDGGEFVDISGWTDTFRRAG